MKCSTIFRELSAAKRMLSETFKKQEENFMDMEFRYSRIDSGIRIDRYIGSAEHLTIPARIDDLPVSEIWDGAFSCCSSLAKITIPNGVTFIGNATFRDCWNLTEITIPDSVTFIGNDTFRDCWSLTEITIPNSITYIGEDAFGGCEHLEIIYINAATLSRGSVRRSINAIREQNPSCKILPIPTE